MKCSRPAALVVTHIKYDFLSLLPVTESLAVRGRRLHDTPYQRQNKVYAPDILLKVDVEDSGYRLQSSFVDNRHLYLYQGECEQIDISIHNSGRRPISEVWIVTESNSEVWLDAAQSDETGKITIPKLDLVLIPVKSAIQKMHPSFILKTRSHLQRLDGLTWLAFIQKHR